MFKVVLCSSAYIKSRPFIFRFKDSVSFYFLSPVSFPFYVSSARCCSFKTLDLKMNDINLIWALEYNTTGEHEIRCPQGSLRCELHVRLPALRCAAAKSAGPEGTGRARGIMTPTGS
jgi:hypothetical protein